MTGCFEIYRKTYREIEHLGEIGKLRDYKLEHVKSVELPEEVYQYLQEEWPKLDFDDEIIIRCELPI